LLADPTSDLFFSTEAAEQEKALEDRDYYASANVFWVPAVARWETLRNQAKQPEIGRLLDEALVAIEDANPSLKNILDKRFARTQIEPSRLGSLRLPYDDDLRSCRTDSRHSGRLQRAGVHDGSEDT